MLESNQAHAGRAIPMKFTLGGNYGLNILNPGEPTTQQLDCTTGTPIGQPASTIPSGDGALQYDAATDTYSYL
ncbi:PxKF domain-containing protein [Kitasatospora sp. NPDC059646]|uniref:PxKF domain-containing protein n=1 Tax=Kitasatospora sp. NPDC059646 TaxID=3346893 RepID=UPI0036CC0915